MTEKQPQAIRNRPISARRKIAHFQPKRHGRDRMHGRKLTSFSQKIRFSCRRTTSSDSFDRFSCRRTTSSDSFERISCRRTTSSDSLERISCRRTTSSDSFERISCRRTTSSDSFERISCRRTTSSDSFARISCRRTTALHEIPDPRAHFGFPYEPGAMTNRNVSPHAICAACTDFFCGKFTQLAHLCRPFAKSGA